VTFQVIEEEETTSPDGETQMFKVLSRRASFVDINVLGDYIIDLQAQDARMDGSFPMLNPNRISVVDSLLIPWNNILEIVSSKEIKSLYIGKPLIVRSDLVNNGNI
jgi:hypothetical protein